MVVLYPKIWIESIEIGRVQYLRGTLEGISGFVLTHTVQYYSFVRTVW